MNAGEMNRRIIFQQNEGTRNELNEIIPNWVEHKTVWANVQETGGREIYQAQKVNAETTAVFKIRWRRINTKMRIIHDNRTVEILFVADPDGRRDQLNIATKEVV